MVVSMARSAARDAAASRRTCRSWSHSGQEPPRRVAHRANIDVERDQYIWL